MQMQIYNKKTKELIAWIETRTGDIVLNDAYGVRTGKNLKVREDEYYADSRYKKGDGKRKKVRIAG